MSDINIIRKRGMAIAMLEEQTIITNTSALLDIMASAQYADPEFVGMIVKKGNLTEEFFDLKTGFAGEILQKFSNYRVKLAIIGDFSYNGSNSLADFIRECNRGNQIFFVKGMDEAIEKMEGK